MIPKGLKVGDTYTVEGMTYEVTKVIGENYESKWVGNTSPTLVADKEDYESMQYATLKKLCAEKGLDAKGSKADLVARLEG